MIDRLIAKALRLVTVLVILALLFVGLVGYTATSGDSRMIVLFTLGVLAYGCWRVFRAAQFLWLKLNGNWARRQPSDEAMRPALWLSPRTLRAYRSAHTHDSRGRVVSSKRKRDKQKRSKSLYSGEYTPSTASEQAGRLDAGR